VERVIVEPGTEGLAVMLAELTKANLIAEPERLKLLEGNPATVLLHILDADVEVSIRFTGSGLHIGPPSEDADMTIATDAHTLMELTNVPLRFGMPDQLTPKGRAIAAKLLNGEIAVSGLPRQLPLMIRLQRLFTVA